MRGYNDNSSVADESVLTGLERRGSANTYDLMGETPVVSERKSAANSYFHSYETMVRSQDAEDIATISHLRPIFKRIQRLGRNESITRNSRNDRLRDTSFTADHDDTFQGHSKQDDKSTCRALWSHNKTGTYPPAKTLDVSLLDNSMCDPREILTFAAIQRFATILRVHDLDSMNNEEKGTDSLIDNSEFYFIQTDEQLMMILAKFEEEIDGWRRAFRGKTEELDEAGITFSEFVHVYKTIISGMKALQMLPSLHHYLGEKDESMATSFNLGEDMKDIISHQREKTIKRSLKMIKEFTRVSSFALAAVISGSDDDSAISGSDNKVIRSTQDIVNKTNGTMISRAVSPTSESERELESMQDDAAAFVDIRQLSNAKRNEMQAITVEPLRNLRGSKQKDRDNISSEAGNYGVLSVIGLIIFVACVSSGATYQTMSWLVPLTSHSDITPLDSHYQYETKVTLEQEVSTKQHLKISLEDTIRSRDKSEDKLARAATRIGTMMLQLEDVNNELVAKNDALSICEGEKLTKLKKEMLPFCQIGLDSSIVQPVLSQTNFMHDSVSRDSGEGISFDSQNSVRVGKVEPQMKMAIDVKQKNSLLNFFANIHLHNIIGTAANAIKCFYSGLVKLSVVVSNVMQRARSFRNKI